MKIETVRRSERFLCALGVLLLICLVSLVVMRISREPSLVVRAASPHQFHVSGQAIPAVAAAPTPIEGTALTTDVNVDFLVIANTDTNAHTVTVVDCTSVTPFSLFTSYTIAASTMWPVPLGNMRFRGCFKWSASSTTVMGSVVGTR